MNKSQRFKRIAGREYLPMAVTIALWAAVVAAIGHADAARLLAATMAIRATQLLTKLATSMPLKRRIRASRGVRRQAKRFAFNLQAGALIVGLLLVVMLAEGLKAIGQQQIAAFLPFLALGMPARYLRVTDVRTASPHYRLALATSGLALVLLGWAAAWHVVAFAVAIAGREWIAFAVLRWWPRPPRKPLAQLGGPLRFEEVAQFTALLGRQLLTYRLSKSALMVFGPFGTAAARTGRGLDWHKRIEPYLPHHFGGFVLFTAAISGGAALLALRSGEPAAMIAAAGLLQIAAVTANILLFWRYLPPKGGDALAAEDDEDE